MFRNVKVPVVPGSDFEGFLLAAPHMDRPLDITEEMSNGKYGFWMKVPIELYGYIPESGVAHLGIRVHENE